MIEIFGYPYADDIGPGGTIRTATTARTSTTTCTWTHLLADRVRFDTPVQADMAVRRVKRFKGYYRPAANAGFFNTSRTGTLGGVQR